MFLTRTYQFISVLCSIVSIGSHDLQKYYDWIRNNSGKPPPPIPALFKKSRTEDLLLSYFIKKGVTSYLNVSQAAGNVVPPYSITSGGGSTKKASATRGIQRESITKLNPGDVSTAAVLEDDTSDSESESEEENIAAATLPAASEVATPQSRAVRAANEVGRRQVKFVHPLLLTITTWFLYSIF